MLSNCSLVLKVKPLLPRSNSTITKCLQPSMVSWILFTRTSATMITTQDRIKLDIANASITINAAIAKLEELPRSNRSPTPIDQISESRRYFREYLQAQSPCSDTFPPTPPMVRSPSPSTKGTSHHKIRARHQRANRVDKREVAPTKRRRRKKMKQITKHLSSREARSSRSRKSFWELDASGAPVKV